MGVPSDVHVHVGMPETVEGAKKEDGALDLHPKSVTLARILRGAVCAARLLSDGRGAPPLRWNSFGDEVLG